MEIFMNKVRVKDKNKSASRTKSVVTAVTAKTHKAWAKHCKKQDISSAEYIRRLIDLELK